MKKRIYASAVHLAISSLLVSGVFALVIFLWYPNPYFLAMGISKILLILAAVDVTIGPLITLIIFNPLKKSLKFDLAVIALLQLSALVYGTYTVFSARPAYIVYNVGRFTVVSPSDIPLSELDKVPGFTFPFDGPKLVGARLPVGKSDRERILFSAAQGGSDLPQMPQYYLPYTSLTNDVTARLLTLDNLTSVVPKDKVIAVQDEIVKALQQKGLQLAEVGFAPMLAKTNILTVVVRRQDAVIVAILPVNPWAQ